MPELQASMTAEMDRPQNDWRAALARKFAWRFRLSPIPIGCAD
jgi:hypothetical protein